MNQVIFKNQVIHFPRLWCAPRSLLSQGPMMQSTVGMNYDFHHVIETYKRFFPSQAIVQMKQDYNIEFAKASDSSARVFREFYYKVINNE